MRLDPKRPRNLLRTAIRQILGQPIFTQAASPQALQCAQRAQRLKEQMEWLSTVATETYTDTPMPQQR